MTKSPKLCIFVTTQFEGLHRWPDAPDEVKFLQSPHRHMFHVRVTMTVTHDDREVEFILVKRALNKYFRGYPTDLGARSCEQVAKEILAFLRESYGKRGYRIEISEDGENGAIVTDGKGA